MSYQNNRFTFDIARQEDSQQISEILESNPFKGNVSLVYARRPDAYASFLYEGKETEVIVCRDKHNGQLAGFGAYVVRDVYVNGRPQRDRKSVV